MKQASLVVLVVEDNPADVLFFVETIEWAGVDMQVLVVGDGEEALAFLGRRGSHAAAPRPGLIVLDLNLPIKGGREVLAELAIDPSLSDIPVAVMSSSKAESDVCDLYPKGRCRYFRKTGDFKELAEILQQMEQFAQAVAGDAA